ncbi:putative uncharacterized protein [Firmicutes bacterium CAG:24]|jgi:hypothetical protein|nr:putative uncharacterized protein [Firmicutes bacterium CAG:24]
MNLMQMTQAMKNPQQFLQNMMGNNQIMRNPMAKNTLEMAQKGDFQGIENIAKNLCKEKGINPDEMMNQIKKQMGM